MDIWQILMFPFSMLLKFFCEIFNSYGLALILFTIIVKVILFPFNMKGKKGMIKMQMVSGQLQEIQKRCGNDKERYNREVTKFYQDNGISPMGGCGWSFVPMLILFPLYAIIRRPLKYMMNLGDAATTAIANALNFEAVTGNPFNVAGVGELTLASMLNKDNLATAVTAAGATTSGIFGMFVINFNFLGMDLSRTPQLAFWNSELFKSGDYWGAIGLFLMPVISAGLSVVSMIVSQKTNQMSQQQQQQTNWSMMLISPLMSLWIGFTLPAGLCVYWIANSLTLMVQEVIAGKLLKKDYEAVQKELAEAAARAKAAEKEKRRQAAERKAEAIRLGLKPEKKRATTGDVTASREGIRAYARGRAYDPNRYPITPYHDPNGPAKDVAMAVEEAPVDTTAPADAAEPAEPPAIEAPAENTESTDAQN